MYTMVSMDHSQQYTTSGIPQSTHIPPAFEAPPVVPVSSDPVEEVVVVVVVTGVVVVVVTGVVGVVVQVVVLPVRKAAKRSKVPAPACEPSRSVPRAIPANNLVMLSSFDFRVRTASALVLEATPSRKMDIRERSISSLKGGVFAADRATPG
jgi:heme/copper-type cytochrome/quinol oxidase subunit 2